MEIPWQKLSETTLQGVIKDFVLREGTDYGPVTYSLEQKVSQVMKQLSRGEAKILYDTKLGTCNVVKADSPELRKAAESFNSAKDTKV